MLELSALVFEYSIIAVVAVIVFSVVCVKRRDLLAWLPMYILLAIGFVLINFESVMEELSLISYVFIMLSVLSIFVVVVKEYYTTFIKYNNSKNQSIIAAASIINLAISGILMVLLILLVISLFLFIRIYKKKNTPTHAFLGIVIIAAIIVVINQLYSSLGGNIIPNFGEGLMIFFVTVLLVTGLVALIEERMVKVNNTMTTVLSAASKASMNISNIATELAATASEVNVASEEISVSTNCQSVPPTGGISTSPHLIPFRPFRKSSIFPASPDPVTLTER